MRLLAQHVPHGTTRQLAAHGPTCPQAAPACTQPSLQPTCGRLCLHRRLLGGRRLCLRVKQLQKVIVAVILQHGSRPAGASLADTVAASWRLLGLFQQAQQLIVELCIVELCRQAAWGEEREGRDEGGVRGAARPASLTADTAALKSRSSERQREGVESMAAGREAVLRVTSQQAGASLH